MLFSRLFTPVLVMSLANDARISFMTILDERTQKGEWRRKIFCLASFYLCRFCDFCRPLVHVRSFRRDGPWSTRRLFDGVAGMQPLDALSEGDGKFLLHKHGLQ